MSLRAQAWVRRPVTLTPLIDIIFLLLLFFMLSSTFTRFAEVPLQNAGGGAAPGESAPIFLQLLPENLLLNGQEVPLEALTMALRTLRPEDANATLLVTLQGDVTSQALVDVLVEVRSEAWLSVAVLN